MKRKHEEDFLAPPVANVASIEGFVSELTKNIR
jgi:hypothetical protein